MDQTVAPAGRSWTKACLHLLRRAHLYAGLFLVPWAVLYGITAFLFNHPTEFSDQPYVEFGRDTLVGTSMEAPPTPGMVADQVVAALRDRSPGSTYTLVESASPKYTREFAFAVVRSEGRETNVLIDVTGAGGSVRSREVPPAKPEVRAPFAVPGSVPQPPPRAGGAPDRLVISNPLGDKVKSAVPTILERTGFPAGEVTVTSVPDVTFLMDADGRRWRVIYNPLTGSVRGRPAEDDDAPATPSTRSFLLRLHSAHGYPYRAGPGQAWAVLVDVMAAALLFWAMTGLVMWWQVRAARRAGAIVLIASAGVAAVLVSAMWSGMTG
jgi:hypothetical protein